MDLFFQSLPVPHKVRYHYHAFLLSLYQAVRPALSHRASPARAPLTPPVPPTDPPRARATAPAERGRGASGERAVRARRQGRVPVEPQGGDEGARDQPGLADGLRRCVSFCSCSFAPSSAGLYAPRLTLGLLVMQEGARRATRRSTRASSSSPRSRSTSSRPTAGSSRSTRCSSSTSPAQVSSVGS